MPPTKEEERKGCSYCRQCCEVKCAVCCAQGFDQFFTSETYPSLVLPPVPQPEVRIHCQDNLPDEVQFGIADTIALI
eukprot:scaffold8383_cov115-Skeletonema_dohrnii-CCMP3373.AAC.1